MRTERKSVETARDCEYRKDAERQERSGRKRTLLETLSSDLRRSRVEGFVHSDNDESG